MAYRISAHRLVTEDDLRLLGREFFANMIRNRVNVTNDGRLRVPSLQIRRWLAENTTGLYFIQEYFADGETSRPFSVAFENETDVVQFSLFFSGMDPKA